MDGQHPLPVDDDRVRWRLVAIPAALLVAAAAAEGRAELATATLC